MTRLVGLLGGTFDPIHHGHLRLALECAAAAGCDETRLIPAYQPPHRAAPVASAAQRLAMVQLAVRGDAALRADDCEVRRAGTSYTIDTLAALRRELAAPLCLFLGADAYRQLRTWHRWEQILDHAHLVVADRPGPAAPGDAALDELEQRHGVVDAVGLHARTTGAILRVTVPALDISSTRIRTLVAAGRSVRYLVPGPVIHYIQQEGLYRNPA